MFCKPQQYVPKSLIVKGKGISMQYKIIQRFGGWQRCSDMSTCANFKVNFKNLFLLFLLVLAYVKVEYNDSYSELRSQSYGCSENFNENNCIFVRKCEKLLEY